MLETIDTALPYITAIIFGLALLLLIVAVRLFRRSRTDTYWRRRRDAGQRGLHVSVLAFIFFMAGGVMCLVTLLVTMIHDDNEIPATPDLAAQQTQNAPAASPTATLTLAPETPDQSGQTPLPEPTHTQVTPEPTATPRATDTPIILVITTTPMHTPTQTPFPTFTPRAITSIPGGITPQPEASLTITALDDRISDTLEPVNPRTTFIAGTHRIYFFVEYAAMSDGVAWTRKLYKNGEQIDSVSYDWRQGRTGTTYFFFGSADGFEPGNYEIRLFIGASDQPVSTRNFMVLPAP